MLDTCPIGPPPLRSHNRPAKTLQTHETTRHSVSVSPTSYLVKLQNCIYLSIHLSISVSIYLSILLSICLLVYLSICLAYLCIYLPTYQSNYAYMHIIRDAEEAFAHPAATSRIQAPCEAQTTLADGVLRPSRGNSFLIVENSPCQAAVRQESHGCR